MRYRSETLAHSWRDAAESRCPAAPLPRTKIEEDHSEEDQCEVEGFAAEVLFLEDQGMTIYQLLQKIYKEYGYRKEGLTSLVRKGKSGAEEIQKIMADMRQCPPASLIGSPVTKVVDYLKTDETGLPSSNVLQFFDEAGDVVSVRPSGTEPKIKFYFGAKGDDADAKIERLKEQFIK